MTTLKKIGVIGTGWIFQNEHVLGYLDADDGYIAGFHDVSEEVAKKAINLYKTGIKKRLGSARSSSEKLLCQKALECKYYEDLQDLLSVIDGVDICTPPQYHIHYAKIAADEGKAVLCEKPLARTYLDAEEALKSLKNVPFYIFTQVIYNPIFKKGKELIESGVIGDIKKMRCCHATLDLSHTLEKESFWNPLKSGGGALKDIGPHAFSVLRYWLGKDYSLKSVKDAGITTVNSTRNVEGNPNYQVIVEDKALVDAEWENDEGGIVNSRLEAYWLEKKNLPKELKLAGLYHEVEGTEGKMTFPNGTIGLMLREKPYFKIHVYFKVERPDGTVEKYSMVNPKEHSESKIAIQEFISGDKSRSPAWYGKDMMILLDSAYLSKKKGGKMINPEEYLEYAKDVAKGETPKEKGDALIKDLFDL